MAKTYYGYKERDLDNLSDWADTGTKISAAIEQEAKSRETRKQDYITANQTFEKNLTSKIPRSQDASLNNQILAALQTQLDGYYTDYNSFTQGDIPENQWVQIRQNRQDGLENYLGLMQDYSKMADEKINRQLNNESQPWEQKTMSQIEGFNDYSKWQMNSDEMGNTFMQKVDENGEYIDEPGSIVSLSLARKQTGTFYDRYDLDGGVKKGVKRFGKTKLAIMKQGVKTREAITNNPIWKKALNDIAQSELGNPFNRLSILSMDMGGNVVEVYSEEEAGIDDDGTYKVYMKTNPISKLKEPQFTEEQDKAIYDRYEDMVLTQSDIIEEGYQKTIQPDPQWKHLLRKDKKKQAELYRAIKGMLGSSNPQEWESRINDVGSLSSVRSGGELKVVAGTDGPQFKFINNTGETSDLNININDKEATMRTLFLQAGGTEENFRDFYNKHGVPSSINTPDADYSYNVQRSNEIDPKELSKLRDAALAKRSEIINMDGTPAKDDPAYIQWTEVINDYDRQLGKTPLSDKIKNAQKIYQESTKRKGELN
jgi:hypothetical protein